MVGILLLNGVAMLFVLITCPLFMIVKAIIRDHRIEREIEEAWRRHEKLARKCLDCIERGEELPEEMRKERMSACLDYIRAMGRTYGIDGFRQDMEKKYPLTEVPQAW